MTVRRPSLVVEGAAAVITSPMERIVIALNFDSGVCARCGVWIELHIYSAHSICDPKPLWIKLFAHQVLYDSLLNAVS